MPHAPIRVKSIVKECVYLGRRCGLPTKRLSESADGVPGFSMFGCGRSTRFEYEKRDEKLVPALYEMFRLGNRLLYSLSNVSPVGNENSVFAISPRAPAWTPNLPNCCVNSAYA